MVEAPAVLAPVAVATVDTPADGTTAASKVAIRVWDSVAALVGPPASVEAA